MANVFFGVVPPFLLHAQSCPHPGRSNPPVIISHPRQPAGPDMHSPRPGLLVTTVDRGAWTAKTVKQRWQQPAHPQYANYWAPLTRKPHTPPHPAQPRHTNCWAPRTRKRHQQEHRLQRRTESSDPTQHAKGRTGDCLEPRKEATTRRNVTQGAGLTHHAPLDPSPPPFKGPSTTLHSPHQPEQQPLDDAANSTALCKPGSPSAVQRVGEKCSAGSVRVAWMLPGCFISASPYLLGGEEPQSASIWKTGLPCNSPERTESCHPNSRHGTHELDALSLIGCRLNVIKGATNSRQCMSVGDLK